MEKSTRSGKIVLGLLALFLYLPIVYVIVFSFNASKSLSHFTGLSLRWYSQMFSNKTMLDAIYITVIIAIIATVVSTFVGTLAAIGLSKSRKVLRRVVTQVNNLPIMNPEIVTAIGLMLFYTSLHIEKGFLTMLLAHIAFCIPYVMLSVTPRLRRLDPNLADAAMDLGATPLYALRKVILPELTPGIVAGALIAFTMSFDDFVISYFVTGNGVNNISILVYSMSKRVNPTINSLSTIIVLMITIILVVMNVISARRKKNQRAHSKRLAIIVALIAAVAVFGLNSLRNQAKSKFDPIAVTGGDTLNVFNVGEYIDEKTVEKFEAKYNVTVNYSVFASNEELYTKLLGGDSYDVIYPSDYMIERLMNEHMLSKIDLSKITNFNKLDASVLNKPYDPKNEYSVPYFSGSVGIIYDKRKVSRKDVESEGFSVLKDTKYKGKLYVYDSERDSFMMALKALGYSMNTADQKELRAAYDWLMDMKKSMAPVFVTDEVIDGMINGEKDLAVVYSGDAAYIQSENPNMVYYEPSEGTNIWTDAMVIPKNANNKKLAQLWINFNLQENIAYANSKYVGYTSPLSEVRKKLANGVYAKSSAYQYRVGYKNDEVFAYNGDVKKIMSEYWIKVKAAQ